MKGIDKDGISFYKNRNAIIYFEYKYTKEVTMEQLAEKYSITKQRIWQIIRRCQLGEGDYYEGFENFKEKEDSLKELGIENDQIHKLLRKWMSDKYGVKTITLKDERI